MSIYIAILYVCTGITLTLAVLAAHRHPARGALALCLFLLLLGVSSFCYAMELISAELPAKLFWNHAVYLGGVYLSSLMLLLALEFTGRGRWLRPLPMTAIFAVPSLILIASWTNTWHHLYYKNVWVEASGPFLILCKERGPLYGFYFAYSHAIAIGALLLIGRSLRQSSDTTRPQLILLMAAFLLPLLLNIFYLLRITPHRHINLTLLGFFFSSLLISISMFRYRLLSDMMREKQALQEAKHRLEQRNELLLNHANAIIYTINPDGLLTYVSPNWTRLLGHPTKEVIGKRFDVFVLPEDHAVCFAFLQQVVKSGAARSGVEYRVIHRNGTLFWHTSSIMPAKDQNGRIQTYVGAAHDITRMKNTQAQLQEANARLLALIDGREAELRDAINETLTASETAARRIGENLHDMLCQDLIGLTRLAENLERDSAGAPASVRHSLAVMREQAARLTGVARMLSHDLTLHELDILSLPEVLESLARRTEQFFHAEVEINMAPGLDRLSHDQAIHLYHLLREAVANAVKHAQARHIWIDMIPESGTLIVSISNDGAPLPDETQRRDGLGMKQMRMRARLLGGSFSIGRDAQDKTVVQLTMPLNREDTT